MSTMQVQNQGQRRIACIQLDSRHADVAGNTETVLTLASKLIAENKSSPINLLVLPELALTGYVFKSRDEIDPYLEDARLFKPPEAVYLDQTVPTFLTACRSSSTCSKQPSLTLAAHLAQQLHCYVVIGFPELGSHRLSNQTTASVDDLIGPPFDARPHPEKDAKVPIPAPADGHEQSYAFNSAALVAPDGFLKHVFRKHFLFETDQGWASEGEGFEAIHLPGLGNVCIAICMDLNPFRFRTDFKSCELASFCVEKDIDMLVMPMAWLLPTDEQVKSSGHMEPLSKPGPSLSTINYWALRCLPFFDTQHPATLPAESGSLSSPRPKVKYLIANNRTGTEASSMFAGSSCVLEMKLGERPLLLQSLGTTEQTCLVATLPV